MVSNISILFMVISLLIIFLLPVGLIIYFYKKEKISLLAVLVGALVFFIFQVATRLPLLNYLAGLEWFQGIAINMVFIAVFVSLSAGIFEEVGRFVGFKYCLGNILERKNGIAYGIGHGGIEAILLVGFTYINNIAFSIMMINSGTFDKIIVQLGPVTAEIIRDALVKTPPVMFLIGGMERFFSIIIQIALSLIVLYAVRFKKTSFLLYAILIHTLINIPAVMITQHGLSIWISQLYIFIIATAGFLFIKNSKSLFGEK
ncbi:MAG: YhfC family glutamic-type intramembrane protease [Bacillota bacterium]|nr:YhfC family glutamic-type intramembrane protease [Bacillota bacterium]